MAYDDYVECLRNRHERLISERDDYYSGPARRGDIAGWVARSLEATVFDAGSLGERDKGSERDILEIWADLVEVYREFDMRFRKEEYQTRIIQLLETFEYPIPTQVVAGIIGCSKGHARRFYWDGDTDTVREKEWSRRQRDEQAPPELVRQVLERDRRRCVRCRSDVGLVAHHVVPVIQGGSAELANLVTLCESCHRDAHGGALNTGTVVYNPSCTFVQWLDD